jgi:hypothetical protein
VKNQDPQFDGILIGSFTSDREAAWAIADVQEDPRNTVPVQAWLDDPVRVRTLAIDGIQPGLGVVLGRGSTDPRSAEGFRVVLRSDPPSDRMSVYTGYPTIGRDVTATLRERWPAVFQVTAGVFNAEWRQLWPTSEAALADVAKSSLAAQLRSELTEFLTGSEPPEFDAVVLVGLGLGFGYHPRVDGHTVRGWLWRVRDSMP